jgi:hypothetical protein
MRAVGIAAAIVVLVHGRPARAEDSFYLGVGFGGAKLGGELARTFDTNQEVGGRILTGLRRGETAIEVSFFGTDLHYAGGPPDGSHSTLTLGIGVKQYVPLWRPVSIYGRAGVDYTWLAGCPFKPALPPYGYSGPGWDLGAGVELRWRARVPDEHRRTRISGVGASLWLDAGIHRMRLDSADGKPVSGGLSAVNLGFSFDMSWR